MVARSASKFSQPILILIDLGYLHPDGAIDLKTAIERFQLNHGLEDTGDLDLPTVTAIAERWCSRPDIVDGVNLTRLHSPSSDDDGPSCFTLYAGAPRWEKFHLIYWFERNVLEEAKPPFRQAFAQWADNSKFTFEETLGGAAAAAADIKIGFYKGAHGSDCPAFNGPGGTLAHSFKPCDGRLHVDKIQPWSFYPVVSYYFMDLASVALHELGHVLGLNHSSDENAVMFPTLRHRKVKDKLTRYDIEGMKFLYANY